MSAMNGYGDHPTVYHALSNEDFYSMRGTVEVLLRQTGVAYSVAPAKETWLHPGRAAVIRANGEDIAVLGEIHPAVAEAYELSGRVYIAEINLPKLFAASSPMVELYTMMNLEAWISS